MSRKTAHKNPRYLRKEAVSGETDGGVEFAVAEYPLLDTSLVDIEQKIFWPKKMCKGLTFFFLRFWTIFKKIEISVVFD